MPKYVIVLLFLCCGMVSLGQSKKSNRDSFDGPGLNRFVNRKFNSLVTGNPTGTEVSNYASFEPVNGRFTFKGTLPLSSDEHKAAFSYLSLRVEGDLIEGSYASLFSNTVLNTNALVDGQLHFRTTNYLTRIDLDGTTEAMLTEKEAVLRQAHNVKMAKLTSDKWKEGLRLQIKGLNDRSGLLKGQFDAATKLQQQRLDKIKVDAADAKADQAALKKLIEESLAGDKELTNIGYEREAVSVRIDSLTRVLNAPTQGLLMLRINEVQDEYQKALDSLEAKIAPARFRFGWFTVTAGVGKKTFATFYDSLAFAQQLTEPTLSTFRFGLSWNFYSEWKYPKLRNLYLNIGFLRYRDNNLRLLTTQQVVQQKVIKNAAGDTTRTISKTYTAYTKPVTETTLWNLFTNIYFIQPESRGALRISPSVDLYEDHKTFTNLGFGYLISFKNAKKDQPLINAEGYVKLTDLFNQQKAGPGFWKRNEIGISFTVPFNFFLQ